MEGSKHEGALKQKQEVLVPTDAVYTLNNGNMERGDESSCQAQHPDGEWPSITSRLTPAWSLQSHLIQVWLLTLEDLF